MIINKHIICQKVYCKFYSNIFSNRCPYKAFKKKKIIMLNKKKCYEQKIKYFIYIQKTKIHSFLNPILFALNSIHFLKNKCVHILQKKKIE